MFRVRSGTRAHRQRRVVLVRLIATVSVVLGVFVGDPTSQAATTLRH